MPAKNAAIYLNECLDSIINQTIHSWELIVANDHSTDNTPEILRDYQDKDKRITVLENQGNGIIEALRTAYAHSNGSYITRMDADDIMLPKKLEALLKIVQGQKAKRVAVGKVKYFSNGALGQGFIRYADWLNGLGDDNSHFDEIFKECVIPSPAWMCSRENLDLINAFDESRYPEDYDLCFRFCTHGFETRSTDEIVHRWRDYPDRTSRTDEHYKDHRFVELKMHYFNHYFIDHSKALVLWGTGKTAKKMALSLNAKGIKYRWVTDNTKKIGHNIYGCIVEHFSIIDSLQEAQILVRVANNEEQLKIKDYLRSASLRSDFQVYYFC